MNTVKKTLILVTLAMMCAISIQSVSALDTSYDVMPHEGRYDTPVLIWVRCDPLYVADTSWIYIFWDNVPIVGQQRIVSPVSGTLFKWGWDITIIPPEGYNYKGDHRIKIWIEQPGGEKKELNYQYTIINGLPKPEWFESLPQELIDGIRGPRGLQGKAGTDGVNGSIGSVGQTGDTGPQGTTGNEGTAGPQGTQGVKGETGPKGEQGSTGYLVYGCLLISIVSLALVTNIYRRENS